MFRTLGWLFLVSALCVGVLIAIGTPGFSLHTPRAAGEAIGAALAVLMISGIIAGLAYLLGARSRNAPLVCGIVTAILFTAMACKGRQIEMSNTELSASEVQKIKKATEELTKFGEGLRKQLCKDRPEPFPAIPGVSFRPNSYEECK